MQEECIIIIQMIITQMKDKSETVGQFCSFSEMVGYIQVECFKPLKNDKIFYCLPLKNACNRKIHGTPKAARDEVLERSRGWGW